MNTNKVNSDPPGRTVWPSGLRRWLQAPVRKGVGSNPTAVILNMSTTEHAPLNATRACPDTVANDGPITQELCSTCNTKTPARSAVHLLLERKLHDMRETKITAAHDL